MKVIFLDIDGVLNSAAYQAEWGGDPPSNVDETRLPLLRRILEETGAVIVLSTSWRLYWSPDPALCAPEWRETGEVLTRYGIPILDRTPAYNGNNRDREIRDWLAAHAGEVESFAILDDIPFGWGDLSDRLVRTDMRKGRGLMESHVQKAIALLQTPIAP